jgi:hypothetical protein
MTQAVMALVEYAFNTLGLNRVYAEPYISNPASLAFWKGGLRVRGDPSSQCHQETQGADQAMYARIRPGIVGGCYDRGCVEPGRSPSGVTIRCDLRPGTSAT